MMRGSTWFWGAIFGVGVTAGAMACSGTGGSPDDDEPGGSAGVGGGAGQGGTSGTSGTSGGGTGGSGGDIVLPDAGGFDAADPDARCVSTTQAVDNAIDVIFMIDNSCSMEEEIQQVRDNINGSFTDIIRQSAIDWRVIMISQRQLGGPLAGSFNVCVTPPLAGPNCADNPPQFRHLPCVVESADSLEVARDTYDGRHNQQARPGAIILHPCFARWDDKIRFDSTKIFVVVTDDDAPAQSIPGGGIPAAQFDTWATQNVQPAGVLGTKAARKYIFFGVTGQSMTDPTQACPGAMAPGQQYQQLAQLTGGFTRSICESDWSDIFRTIANGIVSRVSCELNVPRPTGGQTIDPNKVNVTFTPGGGAPQAVLQDNNGPCASPTVDGWQWNADKSKILLCGQACTRAQADPRARVELALGCATDIRPPE